MSDEKVDLRAELDKVEIMIKELKLSYEQYFTGLSPFAPDQLHNEVKRQLRMLLSAPFKSSALAFRLKTIKGRYHTFETYWQRVLKQREEGTYSKDVFKADLRERAALEEAHSQTAQGAAERGMEQLFNSYKQALENQTGQKQKMDYEAFQKSLVQRAKDLKEKHGVTKLSFKVVTKDGKVTIQAQSKS